MSITYITGNKNKLAEVQAILKERNVQATILSENIELPEIQGTPYEIAAEKARCAYKQLKRPVLIEDTSLCFNAMNGMPGPFIKWFLENMSLTDIYRMLGDFPDKSAYCFSVVVYMEDDTKPMHCWSGQCNGTIIDPMLSLNSKPFGWDPLFMPDGYNKTFADLDETIKNKISHRYCAFSKFIDYLKDKVACKIYVAGKWANKTTINCFQKTLIDAGHIITHDWTKNESSMTESAMLDIKGVVNCDILIAIMDDKTYPFRGTFTEIGCALGLKKRIIVVCPDSDEYACRSNCFFWHPDIEHVNTIDDAVKLIQI